MDAHGSGTLVEPPREAGPAVAPAPAAAPAPRPRKPARPVPERDDAYAHLTLDRLRSYRKALADEEAKVSYWRRILQARLDLVRAGMTGGSARDVDTEALRPVLTDERIGAGRRALVEVLPIDDIPPLPQIELLWDRRPDPDDAAAMADLESDLADAERQLSEYRTALHGRIGDATAELIARYREQPALCLDALPVQPRRAAS